MLVLLLFTLQAVHARSFNITYFIVPEVVPPQQHEVELECKYDADFTLLTWFKGPNEIFRYKPGSTPSTRSFPILGVGRVDMLFCGPTSCRLRLGALSEEATGLYRCDIERESPPYMFETRTAFMSVHEFAHRKPLLEGLAGKYGEGDTIRAYCKGSPDAEFRWYINGIEIEEMRGRKSLKHKSSRMLFYGLPPTMTVQCAEFKPSHPTLLGSKEAKAKWDEQCQIKGQRAQEHRNKAANPYSVSVVPIFILLINVLS